MRIFNPAFLNTILVFWARIATALPTSDLKINHTLHTANTNLSSSLQCIESPDWATPSFRPFDCWSAIETFTTTEVWNHGGTIYEFLSASLVPVYPQFAISTPRKYVYNSCTMAIVMMADFSPQSIPPGITFPRTDLCRFAEIDTAVKNVRDGCLAILLGKENGNVGGLRFLNPTGFNRAGTMIDSSPSLGLLCTLMKTCASP